MSIVADVMHAYNLAYFTDGEPPVHLFLSEEKYEALRNEVKHDFELAHDNEGQQGEFFMGMKIIKFPGLVAGKGWYPTTFLNKQTTSTKHES